MPSLQYCIEHAPSIAQQVVNEWSIRAKSGGAASLTSDFKALLEQASQYHALTRDASMRRETYTRLSQGPAADRERDALARESADAERLARAAFAAAYKKFRDDHGSGD